ncbi:MAG TPA: FHA domain-containing protein [Gemmataceae bacterium]|jgi:predicted component of type VI protein secretion system
MKLGIVVLTPGPAEGKVISINLPQFVIGRDPACQLRPASLQISKRHCALLRREDKVFVRDFGSTNGTFVNDRQIEGEIELLDGDRLRVGPLTFAVRVEMASFDQTVPLPATKETKHKQASGQAVPAPTQESPRAASDEDEAAATLLAMQESGVPDSGQPSEVPEGSTVHDIPSPLVADKEKPKQPSGDTSASAKSILEKYLKRPRPS